MDLDYSHPDELPDYFRNILAKYSHAGKQKRRSYSFGQKLAIIKWINFQYASSPAPNISEAAKKTGLSRAIIREWLADAEIIQKQVDDVKVLGSSNKYGGMEKRKRIRVMAPLNSQVENALLVYFDNRCDENLPISRKLLMKQSVKIARELEFRDFKGSKGYIHRFFCAGTI